MSSRNKCRLNYNSMYWYERIKCVKILLFVTRWQWVVTKGLICAFFLARLIDVFLVVKCIDHLCINRRKSWILLLLMKSIFGRICYAIMYRYRFNRFGSYCLAIWQLHRRKIVRHRIGGPIPVAFVLVYRDIRHWRFWCAHNQWRAGFGYIMEGIVSTISTLKGSGALLLLKIDCKSL